MLFYLVISLFWLFGLSSAENEYNHEPFVTQFQWNYINYTWPSYSAYILSKHNESYIKENIIISGIKTWNNRISLSVPRYKKGVPATLAVISSFTQNDIVSSPLLEPYPNWDMQKIGDCNAFQNVHSMEIDTKNRMWIIDTGRIDTMTEAPQNNCHPKLVILDLENAGQILINYVFPKHVVNYNSTTLKDIVIDHEHGGMAYISDSDEINPGIIVYSLANNTSWKVSHDSMFHVRLINFFEKELDLFGEHVNLNGIALSPASSEGGYRMVYFCPRTSWEMFEVSTKSLIDAHHKKRDIGTSIKLLGEKSSHSDGMMMSNTGKLYFGDLSHNAVEMWDSKLHGTFPNTKRTIAKDPDLIKWPASFAFDDDGQLWCINNRMNDYMHNRMNMSEINYRVVVADVGMNSYQYYEDGSPTEWMVVTTGAATKGLASIVLLLIMFIFGWSL